MRQQSTIVLLSVEYVPPIQHLGWVIIKKPHKFRSLLPVFVVILPTIVKRLKSIVQSCWVVSASGLQSSIPGFSHHQLDLFLNWGEFIHLFQRATQRARTDYWPTIYRAGAAVVSTITSCNITSWFATALAEIREKAHCKQSGKIAPVLWGAIDLTSPTAPSSCCPGNSSLMARMLSYKIFFP